MDKGAKLHRELIDTIAEKPHISVGEKWALKGEAKDTF